MVTLDPRGRAPEASDAGDAPSPAAGPGPGEIRRALWTPLQLLPLLVTPVFLFGRSTGWVADVPIWLLVGSVFVAQCVTVLAYVVWPQGCTPGRMVMRVGVMVFAIGTVSYLTGWGPALVFGFVFAAAENLRVDGPRVTRPLIAWVVVATVVGQVAIALEVLPSFIGAPRAHGLAALTLVGVVVVIALLGWTTAEREAVERSLRASDERFRALVHHASDVILVLDDDTTITYASPSLERVLGYPVGGVTHLGPEVIHPDDLASAAAFFAQVRSAPGESAWLELRLAHADGSWRWCEVGVSNRLDDPSVEGFVCNLHDVTERRLFEQELSHQAYHDALTRLPNRLHFLEALEDALVDPPGGDGPAAGDHEVAVLFLDLDRFKVVNDSLGHEVGDRLLVDVAERVRACVRPADLVARFGGDEFTVLVRGVRTPADATRVAERILDALRQPVTVGGRELLVTTSIGIAVSGRGSGASDLLREADVAMYLAKDRGRARWAFFDATDAPHVVERLELEGELWRSLDRGELLVRFQPEVSLGSGRLEACEALVRWDHPTRGMLGPSEFVPIAEESGLIVAVDRHVLAEACRWAARWNERRPARDRLVVSVNLSPRFVRQTDAVEVISGIVREAAVDPRCLQLEITERTALEDVETTLDTLHRLRALGIRVAIDDFGTGYSSLSYLKSLPIDVVKLDRSFVETLHTDPSDRAIVQAVITMAHALGVRVTAEGVECAEQATHLAALGCDSAMGWHWARAMPPDAIAELVERDAPVPAVPLADVVALPRRA